MKATMTCASGSTSGLWQHGCSPYGALHCGKNISGSLLAREGFVTDPKSPVIATTVPPVSWPILGLSQTMLGPEETIATAPVTPGGSIPPRASDPAAAACCVNVTRCRAALALVFPSAGESSLGDRQYCPNHPPRWCCPHRAPLTSAHRACQLQPPEGRGHLVPSRAISLVSTQVF